MAEMVRLLGEPSVAAIPGSHKAFDSVLLGPFLDQARLPMFPARLVCKLLSYFRAPRAVRANGGWGRAVIALRSSPAGCARGSALLTVLLFRAVTWHHKVSDDVAPRGPMSDLSMQWIGEARGS